MLIVSIIILAILGIFVAYFIWASGLLTKVVVIQKVFPETRIAYITFIGSYSEAYKQTPIVEKAIKEKYGIDLSTQPCFGFYYSNPYEVSSEKCRSVVGKILPADFKESEAPANVSFSVIPKVTALHVEYPIRSILSYILGIRRAYPALAKYEKENKLEGQRMPAVLEIYGYGSEFNKILYAFGIGKATGLWDSFPKEKNQ